jgi:diguanylate cyclase (GGDEF)-like protein
MTKAHILLIGDFDKKFLKDLTQESWEIMHCPDSLRALAIFEHKVIDMIVARDGIDQLTGYELCLLIKSHPAAANLPFILLAEKKRRDYSLDGQLSVFPNRIAEFAETVKKPQSLAKLIKEDLSAFHSQQQNGERSKTISLLPTSLAPSSQNDVVNKVMVALLLERLVSKFMLTLIKRGKQKKQLLSEFFQLAQSILRVDCCGLVISNLHKPCLSLFSNKNLNPDSLNELLEKIKAGLALNESPTIETQLYLEENNNSKISDIVLAPIVADTASLGMLVFAKANGQKFTSLERTIIKYMEMYAQPLIEFLLTQEELDKLQNQQAMRAAIDPLTGVYSLEFLIGFLQQQLLFSFRNKLAASILMIDLDRFSQINEALGQAAGDSILVNLAEKLLGVIRSSDLLARYSSDKFVVVLPNTEMKGARVLAEKLRLEIEQTNFFAGKQHGPSITISIGCAQFDPSDLNPETILKDAKLALQRAKEAGRNKVAV